ncbi:NB-ARC domain containing protein [Parasponia andersonii]|uniref:NB-ARC domain containing protein n=1 Tax=Parasponia andersonii TaxID=3476 RepID=A0A2P5B9F9_PARAD|nr:NB-ARC domain containing protein [Parasponia andersonii]
MEILAREMLEYCDGLPLAIIVLGGPLSTRHTMDEWERLHNNVKTYIRKGKIHEQNSNYSGVSWVLGLSFDELPYHLKLCFLYMAHFPEDVEIRVKELTRIWMAEGLMLLGKHRGILPENLEDMAYECLCELLQSMESLLMPSYKVRRLAIHLKSVGIDNQ